MTGTILLRHALDLLSTGGLLAGCLALGDRLLARAHAGLRPIERLAFGLAIGTGALATTLLVLGALGWLNPFLLWATVLLAVLAGARRIGALRELLAASLASVRGNDRLATGSLRAVLAAVALVLLIGALQPPTDWDSLMYHLEIPRRFLDMGRIHLPADNLHVSFVGVVHMLYLPLLAAGAETGPALVNAAFALVLGLTVFAAAARFTDEATAAAAGVALWGTAALLLVAITPRVDVTLALFLFLAHFAVLIALEGAAWRPLVLAAVCGGLAIGTKPQALLYGVALAPAAVWAVTRARRDAVMRGTLVLAAACVLVALPWLTKNFLLTGTPLYPLFSAEVWPPWVRDLATGRLTVAPGIYDVLGHARERVSFKALLFDPARLTVELEARWFATNPILFLLPLALPGLRTRFMLALLLPALGYLLLLLVPYDYTNLRYLIPAVPALTIAAAEGVRRAATLLLGPRGAARVLLVAGIIALAPSIIAASEAVVTKRGLSTVLGRASRADRLASEPAGGFGSYYQATRWLNRHTAPGDRVLLLFEARGYYFDRDVIQDNVITNWPLLVATGSTSRCLEHSGITHILVNRGSERYYAQRGADLETLGWGAFAGFERRCLSLVHRQADMELFRVGRNGGVTADDEAGA